MDWTKRWKQFIATAARRDKSPGDFCKEVSWAFWLLELKG
jgi:hypothetical protein